MSQISNEIRRSATEIYHGDTICREKTQLLLSLVGLPNGLLPLKEIEEVGYVKDAGSVQEAGFVWVIQKKKIEHKFNQIGKSVQYAKEVTAYVEANRIRKLTGVKTKELLLWVTLSDISVDVPPTGKITFGTPTGLIRSYPVEAFQIQEVKNDKARAEEDKGNDAVEEKKKEFKVSADAAAVVEVKEV